MNIAMLFPGQGSQSLGMLSELAGQYPIITEIYARASAVLDYDLWQLVQQGPEAKLNQTEYTQPALLAADVAVWECWQQENGPMPTVMAGHSLGEYAALVCAKALVFEDAVKLVAHRGRYMQAAVQAGEGAMAAIIGLSNDDVAKVCSEAADGAVLSSANFNSPGQVVIAGNAKAVERALPIAKTKGAKMAVIIPVSVPSHCALMQPAADQLAVELKATNIMQPEISVLHNIDAKAYSDPEKIRQALIQQLTDSVHWCDIIQEMLTLSVTDFIECGPGKVLVGLNKRITKSAKAHSINTPELLKKIITIPNII